MTRPTFEMNNSEIIKNLKLLKIATESEEVWYIIDKAVEDINNLDVQ